MRRTYVRMLLLAGLLFVAGCGLLNDTEMRMSKKANGVWKGVSGDLEVSEGHGIYFYSCYRIEVDETEENASVWWDTGARWFKSPATVKGEQILLTVTGVETTFSIHSEEAATVTFVDSVTFEDTVATFTKELAKIQEDISEQQNLYSVCHG